MEKSIIKSLADSRLNNLLVPHIHKDAVDKLDLKTVANEFVDKCDSIKNKHFGTV